MDKVKEAISVTGQFISSCNGRIGSLPIPAAILWCSCRYRLVRCRLGKQNRIRCNPGAASNRNWNCNSMYWCLKVDSFELWILDSAGERNQGIQNRHAVSEVDGSRRVCQGYRLPRPGQKNENISSQTICRRHTQRDASC